ncbi:hypothetical protein [Kaarinaea lacus]
MSDHNKELAAYIAAKPEPVGDGIKVRGFYRVQIEQPGGFGIAGDSGWLENQITNEGFENLCQLLGGIAGSSAVTHLAIGTGTIPASNATTLQGEVDSRAAVSTAVNGSTAMQFTATFESSDNFLSGQSNIRNVGCFATSSGGSLLAGSTYSSSSCDTNQNVNVTYTWTFA